MRELIPPFPEGDTISSLPFLKKKNLGAALIVQHRDPDEPKDDENHGLMSAARDIISAVKSEDHRALASALQAAYDICESTPHEDPAQISEGDDS